MQPEVSIKMLLGLRSQWMISFACKKDKPLDICLTNSYANVLLDSAPSLFDIVPSVSL